jgi:hypothetical protein
MVTGVPCTAEGGRCGDPVGRLFPSSRSGKGVPDVCAPGGCLFIAESTRIAHPLPRAVQKEKGVEECGLVASFAGPIQVV